VRESSIPRHESTENYSTLNNSRCGDVAKLSTSTDIVLIPEWLRFCAFSKAVQKFHKCELVKTLLKEMTKVILK
jgi:hypothetical protein